jgi:hypothetical protein
MKNINTTEQSEQSILGLSRYQKLRYYNESIDHFDYIDIAQAVAEGEGSFPVEDLAMMDQWIGQADIKGRDIYTNDFVKVYTHKRGREPYIQGLLVYSPVSMAYVACIDYDIKYGLKYLDLRKSVGMEVIGNYHQQGKSVKLGEGGNYEIN